MPEGRGQQSGLALAVRHPADTAGLVLLSGYYFPSLRLDALMVAPGATPVPGDILRYTISPLFGWLTMPLTKRVMFAPAPVAARFKAEYSNAMALQPWQIRATCVDGVMMVPSARSLQAHYGALAMSVVIMAGDGDKIVSYHLAERLRAVIPGSTLRVIPGAGHMVHHVAADEVVATILGVARSSKASTASEEQRPALGRPPMI